MKVIRYLLLNGVLVTALYYGLFEGVQGALNIGLFIVWTTTIFSLFFLNDTVLESIAKSKWSPSVPIWLDIIFDIGIVALLVWHSYLVSGAAYLVHIMMLWSLQEEVNDIRGRVDD